MTADRLAGRGRAVSTGLVGAGVLCIFFVTGACGLVYEVVWQRQLRLVMGNTTYSITTVLCAFMGGMALGSYVGGRLIDRRNDPLRIFAILQASTALNENVIFVRRDDNRPLRVFWGT